MKKLKLEYVAGYLLHGLRVLRVIVKGRENEAPSALYDIVSRDTFFIKSDEHGALADRNDIKLILHPLSDLLDESKDLWIEFSEEFGEMDTQNLREAIVHNRWYALDIKRGWEVKDILYKMHLDLHNLIPQGLAVDINDFNKGI